MRSNRKPLTSFVLSLVGGLIVFLTGIIGLIWFGSGGPYWGGFGGWMTGMLGGSHGFIGGGEFGLYSFISLLGLFSGVIMIIGAILLRIRPQDHLILGVLILVFAIVSFVDMGGYFIGAILGIIGGAFAVRYRPRPTMVKSIQTQ